MDPSADLPAGVRGQLAAEPAQQRRALLNLRHPLFVVRHAASLKIGQGNSADLSNLLEAETDLLATVPAIQLSQLGDETFCADHGLRFPYMMGAMANGISSVELTAAARIAGVLGSFGAAGLRLKVIEEAIDRLMGDAGAHTPTADRRPSAGICFNLIHSPNEPAHEMAVVELYLRRGVRLIEASAYLDLTLHAVLYRVSGIHAARDGRAIAPNKIIAKVSRVEVATKWFSPPPEKMLAELIALGKITPAQARLAAQIPMAQDLTAEADSAGHTDNRPALTLLPTMLALRDRLQQQFNYADPLRVGMGGGIGTPASAAAAFAMGAAYIVTGSINQACIESGSSDVVRKMLAEVQQADVTMAPAADMFEMGVKLQVTKRGTMFAMRAAKLFELYRAYPGIDEIPATERAALEKTIFREPLASIWEKTRAFFNELDPEQVRRAENDKKHKMALVFRWYLGLSSRWANAGEKGREMDYQIWCGPAMGAFNEWAKGSFLESPANRKVGLVAMNILYGAAVATRVQMLRSQGVRLPTEVTRIAPMTLDQLEGQLV